MTDAQFEQTIQQLKDAMAMTASMAPLDNERVKEHQRWLEDHERVFSRHQEAWVRHQRWLEDHERSMLELDQKLDRIAELILRGQGGNGKG